MKIDFLGADCGKRVTKAISEKDFSHLKPGRLYLESYLDSCKNSLINMRDVGGSEEMRQCEIDILALEWKMVHNDIALFEQLDASSTKESVNAIYLAERRDTKSEVELIKKLGELQHDYVVRNGLN